LVYLLSCLAVLFVFYAENIKNGIAYALVLTIFFFANLLYKNIKRIKLKESILLLAFMTAFGFFIAQHVQKNESWSTLYADMKVAAQIDQYDHWKWNGERGYPNNELGKVVSITNYERVAWGVAGVQLLIENPLGYGLVERSFGHLAKIKWPESKLHQNHSGWLDLALGLGLPGIGLILGALILALKQCRAVPGPIGNFGFWLLLSLALLWCTTEVSQKVFFDWLVFAIAWVAALALGDLARDANAKSHSASLG
jgi:O-antigen ligase